MLGILSQAVRDPIPTFWDIIPTLTTLFKECGSLLAENSFLSGSESRAVRWAQLYEQECPFILESPVSTSIPVPFHSISILYKAWQLKCILQLRW